MTHVRINEIAHTDDGLIYVDADYWASEADFLAGQPPQFSDDHRIALPQGLSQADSLTLVKRALRQGYQHAVDKGFLGHRRATHWARTQDHPRLEHLAPLTGHVGPL